MNARSMLLAAIFVVTSLSAHAEAEGNNLAAVEVPAGTGVYHTMTILPPAARGGVHDSGKSASAPRPQPTEVVGGQSEAQVAAWTDPAKRQLADRR